VGGHRILRMAGEGVKPAEIRGAELDRKREKEWRSWRKSGGARANRASGCSDVSKAHPSSPVTLSVLALFRSCHSSAPVALLVLPLFLSCHSYSPVAFSPYFLLSHLHKEKSGEFSFNHKWTTLCRARRVPAPEECWYQKSVDTRIMLASELC
jgi:hypothetical protein